MSLGGQKVSQIRVVNIFEENPAAIEKMTDGLIKTIYKDNKDILDIHVNDDNIIFVIGEGD